MHKKILATLNIGDHCPPITAITYPYLKRYAHKIGAEFIVIDARKFPAWDIRCEKFQLAEIARDTHADWLVYIDSDALVFPEAPDLTALVGKDTIISHGRDFSPYRFRPDHYFRRDGRFFGAGNWFLVASDWTAQDVWRFPDDLTPAQCAANIFPTGPERWHGVDASHLCDDYLISRNIARYGLRATSVADLWTLSGLAHKPVFACHQYLADGAKKLAILTAARDALEQPQPGTN